MPHAPDYVCVGLGEEGWGDAISWPDLPHTVLDVGALPGGCTMWANWALKELPVNFWWGRGLGWDGSLSQALRRKGYRLLLHGDVRCQHHLHGQVGQVGGGPGAAAPAVGPPAAGGTPTPSRPYPYGPYGQTPYRPYGLPPYQPYLALCAGRAGVGGQPGRRQQRLTGGSTRRTPWRGGNRQPSSLLHRLIATVRTWISRNRNPSERRTW